MNVFYRFLAFCYEKIIFVQYFAFVVTFVVSYVMGFYFLSFVIGILMTISGVVVVRYEKRIQYIDTVRDKLTKYTDMLKTHLADKSLPKVDALKQQIELLQSGENDFI